MATQNLTIDDVYEDARHPSDHMPRLADEPDARDGAPVAWVVVWYIAVIGTGMVCGLIAMLIAGGAL